MYNNVNDHFEKIKKWCNNLKTKFQSDLWNLNDLSQKGDSENLTDRLKNVSIPFQKFVELCKIAENDPDSVINHMKYQKNLEGFYWAWPYGITGKQIKNILEKCHSEIEFDREMQKYFSKKRMIFIFKETYNQLPRHHRMLFKQIEHSYWGRDYAIANNALMSIIDNLLKKYMYYPGNTKRKGIMEPMINYYGIFTPKQAPFYLRMKMLSHCINFIFEQYEFSNSIHVKTNKKAHRHIAVHGLKYSNKRVDTLLLLNAIYEILYHNKYMKPFEGTIKIQGRHHKAELAIEKMDLLEKRLKNSGLINQ